MDKLIPSSLRTTFLIHAIIAVIFGLGFFLIPGRSLAFVGWVPEMVQLPESELSIPGGTFVDPVLTRLLGAVLLGLAFQGFRMLSPGRTWLEALPVVEFEAVYCAIAVLAIIFSSFRMERSIPLFGWLILLIYAAFTIVWALFWERGRKAKA